MFPGSFKDFLRKIQSIKESVKCISRKFHKKLQRCFKNLSMKFFCHFVVAWISSQLPEQKEGLFNYDASPKVMLDWGWVKFWLSCCFHNTLKIEEQTNVSTVWWISLPPQPESFRNLKVENSFIKISSCTYTQKAQMRACVTKRAHTCLLYYLSNFIKI